MGLDRLSLVLLIALALSQLLPFPATPAVTLLAFAFLIRISLNIRTSVFIGRLARVRNLRSTKAVHQLSKGT
jgi:hypothetical protein